MQHMLLLFNGTRCWWFWIYPLTWALHGFTGTICSMVHYHVRLGRCLWVNQDHGASAWWCSHIPLSCIRIIYPLSCIYIHPPKLQDRNLRSYSVRFPKLISKVLPQLYKSPIKFKLPSDRYSKGFQRFSIGPERPANCQHFPPPAADTNHVSLAWQCQRNRWVSCTICIVVTYTCLYVYTYIFIHIHAHTHTYIYI